VAAAEVVMAAAAAGVAAAASWVAAVGAAAAALKATGTAVVDVAAVAGGGDKVRSFDSILEYYNYIGRKSLIIKNCTQSLYIGPQYKKGNFVPYIRRKSIIIKNCTQSFAHRTSVQKKKMSLQSFVHRTSVPQKTVTGTIYRGCILLNIRTVFHRKC
jgi:hypothetical protein